MFDEAFSVALRRFGIARGIHNVNLGSTRFQELPLQSESPCVGQFLRFLARQYPLRPSRFIYAPPLFCSPSSSAFVSMRSLSDVDIGPSRAVIACLLLQSSLRRSFPYTIVVSHRSKKHSL